MGCKKLCDKDNSAQKYIGNKIKKNCSNIRGDVDLFEVCSLVFSCDIVIYFIPVAY